MEVVAHWRRIIANFCLFVLAEWGVLHLFAAQSPTPTLCMWGWECLSSWLWHSLEKQSRSKSLEHRPCRPTIFFLFYMDPTPCAQLRARPHCFCVSFTDDTPDCLALVFGSPAIAWGYVFLIATFSQQAHTRHSMLACNAKSDHCCWEPTSLCWCLDA